MIYCMIGSNALYSAILTYSVTSSYSRRPNTLWTYVQLLLPQHHSPIESDPLPPNANRHFSAWIRHCHFTNRHPKRSKRGSKNWFVSPLASGCSWGTSRDCAGINCGARCGKCREVGWGCANCYRWLEMLISFDLYIEANIWLTSFLRFIFLILINSIFFYI